MRVTGGKRCRIAAFEWMDIHMASHKGCVR